MKTPNDFRVIYHGIENEQYFLGHGVSFSRFTDCATGIGHNEIEALNDAFEALAQNGWDTEPIEKQLVSEISNLKKMSSAQEDSLAKTSDCWYYVAVDVC